MATAPIPIPVSQSSDTVISTNNISNWSPKSYGTSGTSESTRTGGPIRKGNLEDDVNKREIVEKSLWRWNLACAIAHLVQAIAALIIANKPSLLWNLAVVKDDGGGGGTVTS